MKVVAVILFRRLVYYRSEQILNLNLTKTAAALPLVILAVLGSYYFLDRKIALLAMNLLKTEASLLTITADIPDILFFLVCFGSGLLWSSFLLQQQRKICNEKTHFYLIAACALPLAYFLKLPFKHIFGRTNTRAWLANQMNDGFHWFNGGNNCSSFPSGHMTVFTAFFIVVWLFYPRYRAISCVLLVVLAAALIITGYHFLSDVIAGAYLGLVAASLSIISVNWFYLKGKKIEKSS